MADQGNPYAAPASSFAPEIPTANLSLRRKLILAMLVLGVLEIVASELLESSLPAPLQAYLKDKADASLASTDLVLLPVAIGWIVLWFASIVSVWRGRSFGDRAFPWVAIAGVPLTMALGPSVSDALSGALGAAGYLAEGALLLEVLRSRKPVPGG